MLRRSSRAGLSGPGRRSVSAKVKSQNLRRNMGLWISLEQFSEVRRKSLTLKAKLRAKPVDNPVGGS
jgi:hypothetical protein